MQNPPHDEKTLVSRPPSSSIAPSPSASIWATNVSQDPQLPPPIAQGATLPIGHPLNIPVQPRTPSPAFQTRLPPPSPSPTPTPTRTRPQTQSQIFPAQNLQPQPQFKSSSHQQQSYRDSIGSRQHRESSGGRPFKPQSSSSQQFALETFNTKTTNAYQHQEQEQVGDFWSRDWDTIMGNVFAGVLILISYALVVMTFPFSLFMCMKVAQEYERIVIFRLGKLLAGGARGPGLFFVLPCIDSYRKLDLRTVTYDVPPQEILSKDSVTVSVDAVVYFRTSDPTRSVTNVSDAFYSTKLLTQTTLRNVLGTKTLAEMLSDREQIAHQAQHALDEGTGPWGIKVERIEVKDIRLPQQLTRAMAAEAEATREARAKVIAAEGEQKASRALKEAASVLSECGTAIQLRYLQTLNNIAAEHNSTIIFPVPVNMFSEFLSNNK